MNDLLLRNVRPMGEAACDVWIRQGRIAAMGPGLQVPTGTAEIDGQHALLLPGLVESHTHLDKTMWGMPWYRNEVGAQLTDRIDNERRWRAATGHDARAQSLALAKAFLAQGTTRIRTHVDIDTDAGLKHLHGVLAMREVLQPWLDLQIVAFPQSGLLGRPGTDALLDEAMALGADVLGGLDPQGIDGQAEASLNLLFALAQRHGKPLDIHLHEAGSMGARTLGLILERVQALGMQGQVVISHGFCLGDMPEAQRDAMLSRMAQLQVAVVTTGTPSRPVPDLLACRAAGVVLAGGNDGIRDAWTPYGKPDMLDRAMHIGLRNNLRRDDDIALALASVTTEGARACGWANYGLQAGCRADLVLVQAQTVAEAVVTQPVREWVLSAGQVVVQRGELIDAIAQLH